MNKDKGFDELYNYVKTNILSYDHNQALPSSFVLRLKGLSEGKYMANKKVKNKANYSYEVILNTFKACKRKIDYAIKNKDFSNETQKFNYIMAIINNNINDIYLRMDSAKKQSDYINKIEIDDSYDESNYKRKTKDKKNKMLKNIW